MDAGGFKTMERQRKQLEDLRKVASPLETRDGNFIAEQPAPAPHLAHPQGCAAIRIVLVAVLRVSRA